jgi:hypothetical protein
MREEDEWRVSDLIDPEQPFVQDVTLARQLLETLKNIESLNRENHDSFGNTRSPEHSIDVRVPKASVEFIENTLSELFEVVAEIEKKRGNMPYLIDRSLFSRGKIAWNQGLTTKDLNDWMDEDRNWMYEETNV